jgi:hypothetical protein
MTPITVCGNTVHADGLADDAPIAAVAAREQRFAKHDDGCRAGAIVVARERASKERLDPEKRERFGGDERAANALGILGPGDVERALDVCADLRERAGVIAPVYESRIRGADAAARAQLGRAEFVEIDETVRFREGKRFERECVDETENGDVRADAERQ